ncbi:hypothetical protein BB560_000062 [Smittium megazygosporum]|uniref:NmrA-like domain-containing protein n=1 Tax=Smittium megazygosporum TaxID=133381 RepID=A0A2T9ZLJ5_9FUNG|nr:hypothetical protein BB560_000062 [Smittium megazygosporum]
MSRAKKVAIITGGNRFVEFVLYSQSKKDQTLDQLIIVLACRNLKKAQQASDLLIKEYSNDLLVVETLSLDTSDLDSVMSAAGEIQNRYEYVNYLFCNAGAMYIESLDWKSIAKGIFTHPIEFLGSTESLNQQVGLLSNQNLGLSFVTNFFGHYVLIKNIIPCLAKAPIVRRVIWTGSNTSDHGFDSNDIQHIHGVLLDTNVLKPYNIRSIVVEPGNVGTNILNSLNSSVRFIFGVGRLTVTPWNGSYPSFYAFSQSDEKLDGKVKYYGNSTRLGTPYVEPVPIKYNLELAKDALNKIDALAKEKNCL